MSLTLTAERFGHYSLTAEDGRSIYFQTDYDFPPLARHLGWSMSLADTLEDEPESMEGARKLACKHESTDGTVMCPACSASAGEFIDAARAWLDDHDGDTFEDTGYEDCLESAEVTNE